MLKETIQHMITTVVNGNFYNTSTLVVDCKNKLGFITQYHVHDIHRVDVINDKLFINQESFKIDDIDDIRMIINIAEVKA